MRSGREETLKKEEERRGGEEVSTVRRGGVEVAWFIRSKWGLLLMGEGQYELRIKTREVVMLPDPNCGRVSLLLPGQRMKCIGLDAVSNKLLP